MRWSIDRWKGGWELGRDYDDPAPSCSPTPNDEPRPSARLKVPKSGDEIIHGAEASGDGADSEGAEPQYAPPSEALERSIVRERCFPDLTCGSLW